MVASRHVLRYFLKRCLFRFAPELALRRFAPNYPREPEMKLVGSLCARKEASIDVGASTGIYTAHMLPYSGRCYALEPRPTVAARLVEKFRFAGSRVAVMAVALSDHTGTATLRVPRHEGGRATIDPANALSDVDECDEVTVPTKELDDIVPSGVGMIKIDVEGHESAVLHGARKCLEDSRPNLLIEIEERHHENGLQEVSTFLSDYDYAGFFLWQGMLRPLDRLESLTQQNSEKHQQVEDISINNFFFLSRQRQQPSRLKRIIQHEDH